MRTLLAPLLSVVLLAGCTAQPSQPQAPIIQATPSVVEHRIQLVEFAPGQQDPVTSDDAAWRSDVVQAAPAKDADPADYGANDKGETWADGIIQAKSYTLAAGAALATHTHGIVIYATEITIDGTINVRNQGAGPNEPGYATTRAATMNLYRGYGETDPSSGEPILWGAGGDDCNGGGYIVLNAPTITLNGNLDAGSDCGQAGIVILEGNVTGAGTITASQVIHRGAT